MGEAVENIPDIIHGQEAAGDDWVKPGRHKGNANIDIVGPNMTFSEWGATMQAARDNERTDWENAHGGAKSWLLSQPAAYKDGRWARDKRLASAIYSA